MNWEDLKIFAAVAETGSVRSAGRAVGRHHSTITRRIDRLERDIGARLFDRRPEGLSLTSAGEKVLVAAHAAAESFLDVERQVVGRDNNLSGELTVTMPEPLAEHVFVPALARLNELYPQLNINLVATGALLDVSRREADVAIRCDNNPPESLVGKRYPAYRTSIYAATDYLDNRDLKANPESGRWVGYWPTDGRYPDWAQLTEFAKVPAWGVFPQFCSQLAAVKAGLGIAILPCFVADSVAGIARITDRKPEPSRDIWVLTHRDLRATARVRAFMRFADEVLNSWEPRLAGDARFIVRSMPTATAAATPLEAETR